MVAKPGHTIGPRIDAARWLLVVCVIVLALELLIDGRARKAASDSEADHRREQVKMIGELRKTAQAMPRLLPVTKRCSCGFFCKCCSCVELEK